VQIVTKILTVYKIQKILLKKAEIVLTEKREIRGAQKLEIIRNKIECGDLSYAGWLCVLEERPFGLRHGSLSGSVTA
jgi:hypothetical protein